MNTDPGANAPRQVPSKHPRRARRQRGLRRERGAALIVALVMVIALTILGLTSSRSSLLQEQMTANTRQQQMAFEGAEAGLRAGERDLWNQLGGGKPPAQQASACTPCQVYRAGELDPSQVATWTSGNVINGPNVAGLAGRPRYFIEQRQATDLSRETGRPEPYLQYYAVYASATGEQQRVRKVLRSTFVLVY